jgi:hypothetical protein
LGEPLGQTCPAWMDVNGDGLVTHGDLDAMFQFLFQCVYAPWRTVVR